MMTEQEVKQNLDSIEAARVGGHLTSIVSIAAEMLVRIAAAQEAIVHLANADLDAQIEEAIKSRAEERAIEMDAEKTKRSFIGKKPV